MCRSTGSSVSAATAAEKLKAAPAPVVIDTEHAKLSASGAKQWTSCAASIQFAAAFEDSTSFPAAEGTCAHGLRELHFAGRDIGLTVGQVQTIDGHDVTIDAAMVKYVVEHCETIETIRGHHIVETRVDFSEWVPDGFGTADSIIIDDEGTCYVIDFKYGAGVRVDALDNLQLLLYALGVWAMFGHVFDIKKFVLVIDQPRMRNYSEWTLDADELLAYGPWFAERAAATAVDDPEFAPSEDACMWCNGRAHCPALRSEVENQLQIDFSEPVIEPAPASGLLSDAMRHLGVIDVFCKAIKAETLAVLKRGEPVEGFKLVKTSPHRKWRNADEAEAALRKSKLKVSEVFKRTLLSPAQAETLLGKNHAVIAAHAFKPDGALTVAKESDRRSAVSSSAAADFSDDI